MLRFSPSTDALSSFYYSVSPADAQKYVLFCCDLVLDLVDRLPLPADERLALGASWKYVRLVAQHIANRWARLQAQCRHADTETLHLHYTMLPRLLDKHIQFTQDEIVRHCPESGSRAALAQNMGLRKNILFLFITSEGQPAPRSSSKLIDCKWIRAT